MATKRIDATALKAEARALIASAKRLPNGGVEDFYTTENYGMVIRYSNGVMTWNNGHTVSFEMDKVPYHVDI